MLRLSLTLAALISVSSLAAQTQDIRWFKDSSATTGGGNAFPFGSNGVRYQAIVPGSTFQNKPAFINDIFVAGRGKNLQVFYPDVEIRMGLTAQVNPTSNWTTNNPNPNYKYRGPLYIDFVTGQWTGIGLSIGKYGPITLPFDLKPLGAAGCFVRNDIILVLGAATNAAGTATLTLGIPSSTGNARIYMHWWNLDGQANTFGWTTSNLGQLILGN